MISMSSCKAQGRRFVKSTESRSHTPAGIHIRATGFSRCVGMVGATLRRGVGGYNCLHGMIVDSTLGVRMVSATGDTVEAFTSYNAKLF